MAWHSVTGKQPSKINVEYLQHMGSDLDVVNAARVSFDKESEWERVAIYGDERIKPVNALAQKDADLIEYLATGLRKKERRMLCDGMVNLGIQYSTGDVDANETFRLASAMIDRIQAIQKHWSPFSQVDAKFRFTVPIFVARQMHRSGVGFSPPQADDFAFSEESRRYVDDQPEFFEPDSWRARDADVKQGSAGDHENQNYGETIACVTNHAAAENYSAMIAAGFAPEQARMNLPMSLMTKFIWKGSLYAWANLCRQRLDAHTQQETRDVALQISEHMVRLFPVSWKALIRC